MASGPLPLKSILRNGKVTVLFSKTGSGLVSQDGESLREFALAGYDGEFRWARDRIISNSVEVFHPDTKSSRYLHYTWADNPRINLYNKEGLPTSPFQLTVGPDRPPRWRDKTEAVALTYDDALDAHLDDATPALDQGGLKAAFYLSATMWGYRNGRR